MNRREAVLRELNLYPQWGLRNQSAPKVGNPLSAEADVELTPPVAGEPHVPIAEVIIPTIATVAAPLESTASEPSSVPASHVDKLNWPELKQQVRGCTACRLRAGCTQTVFGSGDEQADWLFVGEGPGADEDAIGEPFVGEAGKLLDSMLMAIKLKRGKNVYIANVVKCRPPDNRTPIADEIRQCIPYLHRQIELIQPKLIVALGEVASNALLRGHTSLDKDSTLASLRSTPHDYQGIPLIVTYHPAYLLRSPMKKADAWQDLCLAVKIHAGDM